MRSRRSASSASTRSSSGAGPYKRQPLRNSGINAARATQAGQKASCAPDPAQIAVQMMNGTSAPPVCCTSSRCSSARRWACSTRNSADVAGSLGKSARTASNSAFVRALYAASRRSPSSSSLRRPAAKCSRISRIACSRSSSEARRSAPSLTAKMFTGPAEPYPQPRREVRVADGDLQRRRRVGRADVTGTQSAPTPPPPPPAKVVTCLGKPATVSATADQAVITGTPGCRCDRRL
jgi:hypothetical protein